MQSTKFQLSIFGLAVFLLIGFIAPSSADVETIEVELFGFVNNDDARQIRRLLRPWADPEDIVFKTAVDKKGRTRHFTTVVEVTPRKIDPIYRKNKYRESRAFDIYNITRQLRDQRFRGSQIGSRSWVVKTEATVTGNFFAHAGFSRSYIRSVPFWRHWRGDTSAVNHALIAGSWDQKIVFSDNDEFDQLRQEAGKGDQAIEVKGRIAAFDGPYPVMSVREFRTEYIVEPRREEQAEKQQDEAYDYLEEVPEGKDENPPDQSQTDK